jgi:hypothetical protein
MEERRFDELTRVLGAARSRRQVLKGVLGGAAALLLGRGMAPAVADAAPAEVCNRAQCRSEVHQLFLICAKNCGALSGRHGYGHNEDAACTIACATQLAIGIRDCAQNATGCFDNGPCCDHHCVSFETDPMNCGGCGNVCSPGHDCVEGHCQCGDNGTMCNNECVDTQIDSRHCGNCATQCKTCESCAGGVCGPVECGTGKTCCNDQCVDDCPPGQQRDPATCQCSPCFGQADGTTCGTNEVCCQQGCFSNQCPTGKSFNYGTCGCVCDAVTCPTGQLQDPDTCQCVNFCANVTCPECQSCDQSSGACVPLTDLTACGTNQVCCGGFCLDSCNEPLCPSGQYACGVTQPYNPNNNNARPAYTCCDTGAPCCGGNGYLYDFCVGSTYEDTYVCCAPGTNQCGTECCDHVTQSCQQAAADSSLHCCPADAGAVLPDGTCCDAGALAFNCAGGWTCCAGGADCC